MAQNKEKPVRGFSLFLYFLEYFALAGQRVVFLEFELTVYLFLVLSSENGVSRR